MPFMGEKLRYKRMSQGLTIKAASKKSKTKKRHLEALEKEDVLVFKDKQTIIEILEKYTAALNLDREEILEEFEHLWSDSSTAKAYLQKKYKRNSRGIFCGDRRMIAYGAAAVFAALFLSVGGFMIWGGFGLNGVDSELVTYSAENAEEDGTTLDEAGLYVSGEPDEVNDDSFLKTNKEYGLLEDSEEQETVFADEELSFEQAGSSYSTELPEKVLYARAEAEMKKSVEKEAGDRVNGTWNDRAEADLEEEPQEEPQEEKEDPIIKEISEETRAEDDNSDEEDKQEVIANFEEQGAAVPRTDGDHGLFYTGISFIICGLMLLICTTKLCHNYLSRISTRLLQ